MRLSTKIMYDIIMVPNSPFSLSAPACASARVRVLQLLGDVLQLLGELPTGLLRIFFPCLCSQTLTSETDPWDRILKFDELSER